MSYTSKLKNEILEQNVKDNNEIIAELLGIFLSKNCIKNYGIEFTTESEKLIKRVHNNILKVTNIKPQIKITTAKRFNKPKLYTIQILNTSSIEDEYSKFLNSMLKYKKLMYDIKKIDAEIFPIIRGYFLNSGYIKDPKKGYTLDFFIDKEDAATFLYLILKFIDKKVFQADKKNKHIVYIRNSEDILDVIFVIGGLNLFFEYEEITIEKEINNKINRNMNYELANETKKISTSIKQVEMIEYIDEKIGLDSLTKALSELSKLRLKYDSDSFQELADKLNISKSGIRNRFRRIEEIYEELKG